MVGAAPAPYAVNDEEIYETKDHGERERLIESSQETQTAVCLLLILHTSIVKYMNVSHFYILEHSMASNRKSRIPHARGQFGMDNISEVRAKQVGTCTCTPCRTRHIHSNADTLYLP